MSQIPLPRPYQDTEPYWTAAKAHKFILQQCEDCNEYQFYPRGVCSHCLSSRLAWRDASGKGTVYSFSVNHRAPHPGFRDQVPFVLALIELAEGPRMMSHVIGCDPAAVEIGMAVTVTFDDVTSEITLPKFKPA